MLERGRDYAACDNVDRGLELPFSPNVVLLWSQLLILKKIGSDYIL